jgi:hypothetical protein
MQHASRYASVTIPARALLGDLTIDVFLRARPGRERSDQREHVRDGRQMRSDGAHNNLYLAVEIHRLVEIDAAPVQPTTHDYAALHELGIPRWRQARQWHG